MAKGTAKKRRHGEVWTGADHAIRAAKQENKRSTSLSYKDRRTAALARGSQDKIESGKLRLHISKTQREVDRMRERLAAWDDVEEERIEQERLSTLEKEKQNEEQSIKKKRGRLGPETWKLRGAARPAWEVYDFDARYVDPHVKAQEEAQKRASRCRNLLAMYKGRLGQNDGPPQPHCRNFLGFLMQLGMLCLQAKRYKAARGAFLECMELDGTDVPITTARCQLMRMYLEANRPESARRLWERLPRTDNAVWIRYSAALVEYISWNLLKEKGSTRDSAEALLAQAIRANVFCAYYIAYHETFERVMEYTEDIQDAQDSALEEAIEYCCSEQMGAWVGTEGAIEWLQRVVLKGLRGRNGGGSEDSLTAQDLEWSERLKEIEEDFEAATKDRSDESSEQDGEEKEQEEADLLMYSGMFRTAMDMLEDSGEFVKKLDDSEYEEGATIAQAIPVDERESQNSQSNPSEQDASGIDSES